MDSTEDKKKYYVQLEGQSNYTKYSINELKDLASSRTLTLNSLIYHPVHKTWVKIGQTSLKYLFEEKSEKPTKPTQDIEPPSEYLPHLDSYYVQTLGDNFEKKSPDELVKLIEKGEFKPNTLVYNPETKKWLKAGDTHLKVLFNAVKLPEKTENKPVEKEETYPKEQVTSEAQVTSKDETTSEESEWINREKPSITATASSQNFPKVTKSAIGAKLTDATNLDPKTEEKFSELADQLALDPYSVELALEFSEICMKVDDRYRALNSLRTALEGNPFHPALAMKLKEIANEEELKESRYVEKEEPYFNNFVNLVIKYPFLEGGIATFIFPLAMGILKLLTRLSVFSIVGLIIYVMLYLGWGLPFLYRVLTESVDGKDHPPEWDFSYWTEGLIPTLKIIIGLLFYGSPFVLLGIIALFTKTYFLGIFILFAAVPWLLFIEPIVIIFSLYEVNFVNVLNPKLMINTIIRIIGQYMLHIVFIIIIAIPIIFVRTAFGMTGNIILNFFGQILYFYFLMLSLRVMGLMYRQNRWKLLDIIRD
ncbi:DUF4013 domain-containing protein [bacterium]|nr:DUF4013 domain-containing protein [bacterium]